MSWAIITAGKFLGNVEKCVKRGRRVSSAYVIMEGAVCVCRGGIGHCFVAELSL